MSAMDDIHLSPPRRDEPRREFQGLRDLLLALSVSLLAALTMQAQNPTGTAGINAEMTAQDWKGNSGSLPR